jgi:uncharacterized damage-inducible protein DinB
MPFEKGPQLPGSRLEDVDFTEARLHSVSFYGATITDGYLVNADIEADIEGLRLNGIEVGPLVQAERERIFPELAKMRATDPAGLSEAWELVVDLWRSTVERARRLPENVPFERLDDQWSLVETLRHLVMATDCWLRRMVKGLEHPYHPWGLAGSWLTDPAAWGIDPDANPSLEEVLDLRRQRMDEVGQVIETLTPAELERVCVPPATPGHPDREQTVLHCLHVLLNEEWEHHRYAVRDLDALEAGASAG